MLVTSQNENALLILKSKMQIADKPQLIFVHVTDTRPLGRDGSKCQGKWKREHTGNFLFISGMKAVDSQQHTAKHSLTHTALARAK